MATQAIMHVVSGFGYDFLTALTNGQIIINNQDFHGFSSKPLKTSADGQGHDKGCAVAGMAFARDGPAMPFNDAVGDG